jgi:hypothetical protein
MNTSGTLNANWACVNDTEVIESCAAGFFDVDRQVSDGCESHTETCESTNHTNGLGQPYYDCSPLATYDLVSATEAAAAWAHERTGATGFATTCEGSANSVLAATANEWAVWTYAGPSAGHVLSGTGGSDAALCPQTTDPSWN